MLRWLRLRCVLTWLWDAEDGWVFADVLDERLEGLVTEKRLDQVAVAFVLGHQVCILRAEVIAFLRFHGDFAFKLRDVFYEKLVTTSLVENRGTDPFFWIGRLVQKPCS